MRLLLLCLFSAATFSYCNAIGKAALIQMGVEFGAPFTKGAQKRILNELWGSESGRAARSSDVAIFNLSDKDFHLIHSKCTWGGYSSDLFPESAIPQGKSSVYGIESNGFMSGVTCLTKYENHDGSWFEMHVDNPYTGHNVIWAKSSDNLSVLSTLGQGNNNQVRFIVRKHI